MSERRIISDINLSHALSDRRVLDKSHSAFAERRAGENRVSETRGN
jgi:hypothetical protein